MAKKLTAGILGGTGFTGRELVRLLLRHSGIGAIKVYGRTPGQPLHTAHPELKGLYNEPVLPIEPEKIQQEVDILFMALPHGVSMEWAPAFQGKLCLIDLSADYRLDNPEAYTAYYQGQHQDPEALGTYTYGLPELNRQALTTTRRVAVPGCYPTSILLGLLPLLEAGWLTDHVIVDAKSGHSGAGKKMSEALHAAQVTANIQPYKIGSHQHAGEILQTFKAIRGANAPGLTFTPQIMPFDRGILSCLYITLDQPRTQDEVNALYEARLGKEPFVRLYLDGQPPVLKNVTYTNFCDIGCFVDEPNLRVTIIACIDNLIKGAAGQAMQCMNLALGFSETEGLYG